MPSEHTSPYSVSPFSCAWSSGGMGAAWVTPVGELDVATGAQFDATLRTAQAGSPLVVLDLRGLTFLDSIGVHLIVDAANRARWAGRRLITVRGTATVQDVFTRTGTAEDVETFDLHTSGPGVQTIPQLVMALCVA